MKGNTNLTSRNRLLPFISRLIVLFLLGLAAVVASEFSLFEKADSYIYDSFYSITEHKKKSEKTAVISIDDESIQKMGPLPWNGNIWSGILLRLREFGVLETVITEEFPYSADTQENSALSKSMQFNGGTFLPCSIHDFPIRPESKEVEYSESRFLFDCTSDLKISGAEYFYAPSFSFAQNISGTGFYTNFPDKDLTTRKTPLVLPYGEKHIGQLSFCAVLNFFDTRSIEILRNRIIVHGASLSGIKTQAVREDISIPLDRNGKMLIKNHESEESISFYSLARLDSIESTIAENLRLASVKDYSDLPAESASYAANCRYFSSEYEKIFSHRNAILSKCLGFDQDGKAVKNGISKANYNIYFFERKDFFDNLNSYTAAFEKFDGLEKNEELSLLKKLAAEYMAEEKNLRNILEKKICFIGQDYSGSEKRINIPQKKNYAMVKLQADIAETIISRSFTKELNGIYFTGLSVFLALVILISTVKASSKVKVFSGLIYLIVPPAVFFILFSLPEIFIPCTAGILFSLIFYLFIILDEIRINIDYKKQLHGFFDSYVHSGAVREIIKKPQLAQLKPEVKNLTALNVGLNGFHRFYENLGEEQRPEKALEYTEVFREYEKNISDEIINHKGTLDKFSQDKIYSFFGTPCTDRDNAYNACITAIEIVDREHYFNRDKRTLLPLDKENSYPLFFDCRIGIHTGRMIAGDIGNETKSNYTVFGCNAMFAARLEKLNSLYCSKILCSDYTWQEADSGVHKGEIAALHLDYINLRNDGSEVQLHSIIGLKSQLKSDQLEAIALFNEGIKFFLKAEHNGDSKASIEDVKTAYAYFKKARDCYQAAETAEVFMKKCAQFIKNGKFQ